MILSAVDTTFIFDKLTDFYSNFNRIDDYMRVKKVERLRSINAFPGMLESELFQDFDMSPEDMEIDIQPASASHFRDLLDITSSFNNETAPGRKVELFVKEKKTNTILGFIKLNSPLINCKPRNDWLGAAPDLRQFNKHAIMGYVIVPVQPFGFNCLGGKLLSLICCSHEVREIVSKKYDMNLCLFETTSLYGNIKGTSQYDGLKPYLRHGGDTQSDFQMILPDDFYNWIFDWSVEKNGGERLIERAGANASGYKLKYQAKIFGAVRQSIKEHMPERLEEYNALMKKSKQLNTQKRYYRSDYGFANAKEVLLGKEEKLLPNPQNYDKFYLENLVKWWKNKATKRYTKLQEENRLRNTLEVWTEDTINTIDIIR
jgi:hypothetical protein